MDVTRLPANSQSSALDSSQQQQSTRNKKEEIGNEELAEEIRETAEVLISKLMSSNDSVFKYGLIKFIDRVKRYPKSRLCSALHSFGTSSGASNLKVTATAILKRAKRGKIGVQPAAVQRRKVGYL